MTGEISGENPHETMCYIGPKKDYYPGDVSQ